MKSLQSIISEIQKDTIRNKVHSSSAFTLSEMESNLLNIFKEYIKLWYPDIEITETTQIMKFHDKEFQAQNGDILTEESLEIIMSPEFMKEFAEKYPEGLL